MGILLGIGNWELGIMFLIYLFILGTAIGSFLNVLIDRLPNEKSINGRSHCDFCKKTLRWYDLIPVFSFLSTGGRCRYCHKKLSIQYPLIEILTGLIFVLVVIASPAFPSITLRVNAGMTIMLGIMSCMIVIFFTDLKYQIIPDSMQVALLVFGIVNNVIASPALRGAAILNQVGLLRFARNDINLLAMTLNGLIVMLPLLIIFFVTRGKGMGFGDVKLGFNMGILLGVFGGLMAVYIGFVVGGVWGVGALILKKAGLKTKLAFGPFLIIGIIVMLFFSEPIREFILKIY